MSDMAGEVLALGTEVKGWSVGERVSSNFAVDHIFGDATEYKVVPAHALVQFPEHLSYEKASTLP